MKNKQEVMLLGMKGSLQKENGGVRVLFEGENVILQHQDIASAATIITENFEIVYQHYRHAISEGMEDADVQRMSVSIVLHYLYMYNKWRQMYTGMADLDLGFKEEDFEHPGTYDIILYYCKQHFPKDWVSKAAAMVGKTDDEVRGYNERRQQFFDMR